MILLNKYYDFDAKVKLLIFWLSLKHICWDAGPFIWVRPGSSATAVKTSVHMPQLLDPQGGWNMAMLAWNGAG